MDFGLLIQTIAISALPVIFAITLHEAAHGYAARHFGDTTAWVAGRISLNPLRHIDPIGTLVVPGLILATTYLASGSAMLFGWAKPVPVNFSRLRNPLRDMVWVAAAGPAANLGMVLAWALVLKLTDILPANIYSLPLAEMSEIGIGINLVLMVLNLLPLPPLDGGRVAVGLLPLRPAIALSKLEPYGFVILIVLMATGILSLILGPLVGESRTLLLGLFGIVA